MGYYGYMRLWVGTLFPRYQFYPNPAPKFKFYPNPDLKLFFYPNPGNECEFHPNPDQRLFYPSSEMEFYPLIPARNIFYPFIRKEHHHPRDWIAKKGQKRKCLARVSIVQDHAFMPSAYLKTFCPPHKQPHLLVKKNISLNTG